MREFFAAGFDAGMTDIVLETQDVDDLGGVLCEVGRAVVTIEVPDGEPIKDVGKYVVLYRQAGDKWKMAVDIWNTDTMPSA